ncbi:hypothetical protein J7413_15830 [Shimia sp. R10_1]|uniref:hypothetical protein n=1 Tax=Shimia sp. R10_1 TaxID=2821095 RepID=UPI001ADA08D4|nr:hypothetical protein [Shimia sp. R10_1]MBO9475018.1 hypothetical protein [Shimia sp. R10_1]
MPARSLLNRITSALTAPAARPATQTSAPVTIAALKDSLRVLDKDPFLYVVDWDLQIISVFDDLKYDRADVDALAGPMRNHVLQKLKPLGFTQTSGHVISHTTADMQMIMPKFRALGESPFNATHFTKRRPQDFYILTPTQSACVLIDSYPPEEAQERILALIKQQPINIYRILDYMARDDHREAFKPVLGHLKFVQREAVRSEPLCRRRALR